MTNLATMPSPSITELSATDFQHDLAQGAQKAKLLKGIIDQNGLATQIGPSKHVHVEAWITIAKGYGLTADIEWTRPLSDGGYEARAMLIDSRRFDSLLMQGVPLDAAKAAAEVAHAEAECGSEGDAHWVTKPRYQQRSMVQTRAISKVGRLHLSWVVVLAGYSATPAEEMDGVTPFGNQGEEDAPMGICSKHKAPFVHRTGISKPGTANAGKPYDFWTCTQKVGQDYCPSKPEDWLKEQLVRLGLDDHDTLLGAIGGRTWKEFIGGRPYSVVVADLEDQMADSAPSDDVPSDRDEEGEV